MSTALEDKDAIRELLADYCTRLDNDRFEDMAALFTEDGTWETATIFQRMRTGWRKNA